MPEQIYQLVYSSDDDDREAVRIVGTFGDRPAAERARRAILEPQHAAMLKQLRRQLEGAAYDVAHAPNEGRIVVASRAANQRALARAQANLAAVESFDLWERDREPRVIAHDVL